MSPSRTTSRAARGLSRAPRGAHRAVPVGVLIALALVALAVVAVRDLVVDQGWSRGTPWLPAVVDDLDGLEPTNGLLTVATVLGLLGIVLVLAGLLPAARRHTQAPGADQLWSSPSALGAVTRAAADRAPGVLRARVGRAGRRRVVLEVVPRRDQRSDQTALTACREAASAAGSALGARRVDVRPVEEE